MVSSATGDVCLPPPCRKVEREGGGGLGTFYSADDHRRDIELRSHFFGDEIVAVTPTRLPPSGKDVMEWCKQRLREMKEEEGEEEVAGVTEGGRRLDQEVKDRVEVCGDGEMGKEGERGVGQKESDLVYDGRDKELVSGHDGTTTAMLLSDRRSGQGGLSPSMETPTNAVSPVAKRCDDTGLGRGTGDQLASNGCCPFSPHVDEGWELLEGGGESEQTVMASGMDQSVEEEVAAKNGGVELGAMGVDSGAQKPAARLKEERRKVGWGWDVGGGCCV